MDGEEKQTKESESQAGGEKVPGWLFFSKKASLKLKGIWIYILIFLLVAFILTIIILRAVGFIPAAE